MNGYKIDFEEYKKAMIKQFLKSNINQLNSYFNIFVVDKNSQIIDKSCLADCGYYNHVCFGDLLYYLDESRNKQSYDTYLKVVILEPPHTNLCWRDFIINRSWYSDAFLTKDPNSVVFEMNLETDFTTLLAGAMALRIGRKHWSIDLKWFPILLDKGLSEKQTACVFHLLSGYNPSHLNESLTCFKGLSYYGHDLVDFYFVPIEVLLETEKFIPRQISYTKNVGINHSWGKLAESFPRTSPITVALVELFNQNKKFTKDMWGSTTTYHVFDELVDDIVKIVKGNS